MITNVGKYFVENFNARLCLTFSNHQWRIDADPGEISHHQQAALERLFKYNFRDSAAKREPSCIIAYQVKAEQESASAHITDEFGISL